MNVIVVLGAQNSRDGTLSPIARERALCAVEAYRQTPDAWFVFTSSFGHFNQAPQPHAYYMATFVRQIIRDCRALPFVMSTNTVEDAVLTSRLMEQQRKEIESLCVVTSEVHVPRSRLIFEHFFDPRVLRFRSAPNGVRAADLLRLVEHESTAIAQIELQGGIIYEGRLWKRRA